MQLIDNINSNANNDNNDDDDDNDIIHLLMIWITTTLEKRNNVKRGGIKLICIIK